MKKPIVLVIMDGVGKGDGGSGDAVKVANTPNLDKLFATCPYTWLKAHGTAVGLPSDEDMGNSEVGHNALGCGQVYSQGAKLVGESIENGTLFSSPTWIDLTENCVKNGKAMHFLGRKLTASRKPTATSCWMAVTSPPPPRWSMSSSWRTCWPNSAMRPTSTRSLPAVAV